MESLLSKHLKSITDAEFTRIYEDSLKRKGDFMDCRITEKDYHDDDTVSAKSQYEADRQRAIQEFDLLYSINEERPGPKSNYVYGVTTDISEEFE